MIHTLDNVALAMKNGCTYEFSADGLSVKIDGLVYAGENGTEGWKQEG